VHGPLVRLVVGDVLNVSENEIWEMIVTTLPALVKGPDPFRRMSGGSVRPTSTRYIASSVTRSAFEKMNKRDEVYIVLLSLDTLRSPYRNRPTGDKYATWRLKSGPKGCFVTHNGRRVLGSVQPAPKRQRGCIGGRP
jgi:hypothetical protein